MENKPKNYLNDEHLSIGTREYLRVLNAGGRPVESLPVAEARKVLADVQAAVEVDLSGIDEREREIVADGHALTLHLVRPHGSRGRLPYFVFIHGGGWVLGDYSTHPEDWYAIWSSNRKSQRFSSTTRRRPKRNIRRRSMRFTPP